MRDWNDHIEKYRKGELSASEMHKLEKMALSDPFLADALEGVETIGVKEFSGDVHSLNKKISSPTKIVWFTPLRIAAGVILIIGAGVFVFVINQNQQEKQLALESKQQPEATAPLVDSVATEKKEAELLALNKDEQKPEQKIEHKSKPAETEQPKATDATEANTATQQAGEETAKGAGAARIEEITNEDVQVATEELKEETPKVAAVEPQQLKFKIETETRDDTRAKKAAVSDARAFSQTGPVTRTITGQVKSAEDDIPLPGVNVLVKGTAAGAVTDIRGNYSIEITQENPQLVFSFIGLKTNEVTPKDKTVVNVTMDEDISQLSEVVVTGRGLSADPRTDAFKEPVIKMAAPAGGIRAYNRYLEDSLRFPQQALDNKIKGKVTVQFTVTTEGGLTDFNVVRSLGHGCDDEVIRLVKEGPDWTPTTEDDVPVESNVRVKVKFDPAKVSRQ